MMTSDERVTALHEKMNKRHRNRERRKTAIIGSAGAVVGLCLMLVIYSFGMANGIGTAGMYSGSMMLFENVGAYVLVAVVAFTSAVIITVLCMRYRKKNDGNPEKNKKKRGIQ